MGRPIFKHELFNPDEMRVMAAISGGQGCPPELRRCLPLLAASGFLRKYDGPPMAGWEDAYVLTYVGREAYGREAGENWVKDRLEELNVGRSVGA